ncbi:MAG: hypothetical protein R3E87_12965 [Burkholderiaceae bacterium]
MNTRASAILIMAALMAGCAAKATLHGTVTNERTRGVVTGARVTLSEQVTPELEAQAKEGLRADGEVGSKVPSQGPGDAEGKVEIKSESSETNYVGQYRVKLKAGTYDLRVEHPTLQPCADMPTQVTLTDTDDRELDLCLTQPAP